MAEHFFYVAAKPVTRPIMLFFIRVSFEKPRRIIDRPYPRIFLERLGADLVRHVFATANSQSVEFFECHPSPARIDFLAVVERKVDSSDCTAVGDEGPIDGIGSDGSRKGAGEGFG